MSKGTILLLAAVVLLLSIVVTVAPIISAQAYDLYLIKRQCEAGLPRNQICFPTFLPIEMVPTWGDGSLREVE